MRVKHVFFLADLGKLSNLERLDCRHNQLTSVPLLSSCQSLKVRVILTALPSTHKNTIIQRFKKNFLSSMRPCRRRDFFGVFFVCGSYSKRQSCTISRQKSSEKTYVKHTKKTLLFTQDISVWKLMKTKWYHSNAKTLPKIFYLKCHTRGVLSKDKN